MAAELNTNDVLAGKQTWLERTDTGSTDEGNSSPGDSSRSSPSSSSQWSSDGQLGSVRDRALTAPAEVPQPTGGRQLPTLLRAKPSALAQKPARPPPGLAPPSPRACAPAQCLAAPLGLGPSTPADAALSEDAAGKGGIPDAPAPSVGSALHESGMCKPCGWFWKPGSCSNGSECRHCHLCPPGALAKLRKQKAASIKQAARERMQARQEARMLPSQASQEAPMVAVVSPWTMHMAMPAPMAMPGQLSLGSVQHARGICTPCPWFWRPEGCPKGSQCTNCHLCPPGEVESRQMRTAHVAPQRASLEPKKIPVKRSSMNCVIEEDEEEAFSE